MLLSEWDMSIRVVILTALVAKIDELVSKRGRSFLEDAVGKELMRRRQLRALRLAKGAWKKEEHPELRRGVVAYVKRLRRETEQRA
jgi:hypothetical protein